jgi:hypothetical protein
VSPELDVLVPSSGSSAGRLRPLLGALMLVLGLVVAPISTAQADPTYGVMNAEGGIYWRSAPDWNTAVAVTGFGFYPNTIIEVHCYQAGAGNVPGSADYMWEQASDVGGSGYGSGWINEHFINDGQPINQPSPGVPPCGAGGTAPPPTPAPPAPAPPTPVAPAPAGLVFPVFNADGGIYYRYGPHWGETTATPGVGVYNGDQVELICGAFGDPVGPYADTAWSKVRNLSRPVGEGWVNEHFINDGAPSNSFVAGEPMCQPGAVLGASTGGGTSTARNGSLYFSPYSKDPHGPGTTGDIKVQTGAGWVTATSPATVTMNDNEWDRNRDSQGCPKPSSLTPQGQPAFNGGRISTLAAWSKARATPFVFLAGHPDWESKIHYIVLFDPGNSQEFAESKCAQEYHLSIILRNWLIASPSNRLVIFSGVVTADAGHKSIGGYGHAGIQDALFVPLKILGDPRGRHLRSQIVVCNYDSMSHENVWINFRWWMNNAPITVSTCPVNPETGKSPTGWNP